MNQLRMDLLTWLQIRYPAMHPNDLIFLEPAIMLKSDQATLLPGTLHVAQKVRITMAEVSQMDPVTDLGDFCDLVPVRPHAPFRLASCLYLMQRLCAVFLSAHVE